MKQVFIDLFPRAVKIGYQLRLFKTDGFNAVLFINGLCWVGLTIGTAVYILLGDDKIDWGMVVAVIAVGVLEILASGIQVEFVYR